MHAFIENMDVILTYIVEICTILMELFGIAVLVLLAIGQIICLIMTRTWSVLHDVMAGTVAVDMASQMIFETKEEQIEYIKKHHAQEATDASY